MNELMGTEAHVRILRALVDAEEPLTVAELSRRTELTPPGAHKAVNRLLATGFVVRTGGGRTQQHTLRWEDPLVSSLVEMFKSEAGRHDELLTEIRNTFYQVSPPPESLWISRWPDRLGEPLEISLLATSQSLSASLRNFRRALTGVETGFDVTIELHGYTRADLPNVRPEETTFLAGAPVLPRRPERGGLSHADLDERSLRFSQAIVDLIRDDPSLIARARRHIEQVLSGGRGSAQHDLDEWADILRSYSVNRLLSFLVSTGPRAARLRQSSPFFAVLSEVERNRVKTAAARVNDA